MSARARKPTGKPPSSDTQDGDKITTEIVAPGGTPARGGRNEASTPIKAISMKTPSAHREPGPDHTPDLRKVKLRAMSEVQPSQFQTPRNLGYLAPPRDPAEVRARRVRDYVIWGCIAVMLASGIALGVWFLARR